MSGFEMIRRMAVVLVPTQVYLDWTWTCPGADSRLTLQQFEREASVCLLPQTEGDLERRLCQA